MVVVLLAPLYGAYQMHQWQTHEGQVDFIYYQQNQLDFFVGYFVGAMMGFGIAGMCLAFIAATFLGLRIIFTDMVPKIK